MAEPTKHYQPINDGTLISDFKSLFPIMRTKRTVAFLYGFMFAFLAFTVFLAFNPSTNAASSPWFTNIFSSNSTSSSAGDSNGSQFSSIFSYFYPNNSSPQQQQQQQQQVHNFASPRPSQTNTSSSRSSNTTFQSPSIKDEPPSVKNQTESTDSSDETKVLKANQTAFAAPQTPVAVNHTVNSAPTVNKESSIVKNNTQSTEKSDKVTVLKANQTTTAAPKAPAATNQTTTAAPKAPAATNQTITAAPKSPVSTNQPTTAAPKAPVATNQSATSPSGSSEKKNSGKEVKGLAGKGEVSNHTASLSKKKGNGTNSGVSAKRGMGDLVKSLMNCDMFDGEWVKDDSYPLYKPGSCSLIDEQFNCIRNGRPDKDYQKMKWKPKGCNLPRLNGRRLLDLLRGKRLVFVGDSLNRNMWESLVCTLRSSVKDPKKVYEANGRQHFHGEASYSFIFKDYGCSVEFFVSPFLVQEWELSEKDGSKKETLRLDLVGRSSDQYKGADIIVFNTGHWWTHDKTSRGKDYYQEGSHVYGELNVLEAFRKALTTWARWVDANVNPLKSQVFFRGYSASHFSGGQWNSGGQCDSETRPIKNETYLRPYPPKMSVLERVLKGMKTHVTYLNITRMTDFRKDGHPSIYRKQSLSDEERRSPLRFQDCSHWCLPGVPDAWNEVLYAELLIKHYQQQQKRP